MYCKGRDPGTPSDNAHEDSHVHGTRVNSLFQTAVRLNNFGSATREERRA